MPDPRQLPSVPGRINELDTAPSELGMQEPAFGRKLHGRMRPTSHTTDMPCPSLTGLPRCPGDIFHPKSLSSPCRLDTLGARAAQIDLRRTLPGSSAPWTSWPSSVRQSGPMAMAKSSSFNAVTSATVRRYISYSSPLKLFTALQSSKMPILNAYLL